MNIEDRYLASEPRDGAAGGDGTVGTGDAARGVDRDGELEAFSEPETPARPDPGAATDAGAPMGHDVEASGDADASAPPDEADASEESAPPDGSNGGLSGVDGAVDVPVGPSCDGPSIPGCPGAQCSIVAFSVAKFSALTPYLTYVLHVDGSLWRQSGDSTPDELVDTNVRDFSAVDAETVYVLGNDRVLRVETAG
ncbi:MAG: hypothetical protein JOZ69_17950, partial [Myxococcales bacterium]|nr:hypothetical protein [Myxococcales bacterium]